MRYSEVFKRAFIAAYAECRSRFLDEARKRAFNFDWNRFMLWHPELPLEKPVLKLTAENMGLIHWERSPFTFDGAFLGENYWLAGNTPFPIIAVFEHENEIRGFKQEILKLAYIRCPLKIGITYSGPLKRSQHQDLILKWVGETFHDLNKYIKEDPESEYVYLLGVEEGRFDLVWYHLTFDAASGPSSFQVLQVQT